MINAKRAISKVNANELAEFFQVSANLFIVVKDFRGDTFRAVHTLRCAGAVYVLHAFQKKSKTGREMPRRDIELIKQRLREAEQIAKGMER